MCDHPAQEIKVEIDKFIPNPKKSKMGHPLPDHRVRTRSFIKSPHLVHHNAFNMDSCENMIQMALADLDSGKITSI